jgi:hypothetical protein
MTHLTKFVLLLLLAGSLPALAAQQHALVMGINHYQYLSQLEGAVNDALVLRDALRSINVQLPDKRVLLDTNATRTTFVWAWQDMLRQAKPGDTLIVTFSGHGGQQLDTPPVDEEDNKDETLTFYDFNPYQPTQGRITDDELYGLFKQASAYRIVALVDACHSSGMVRSTEQPLVRFRNGGGTSWNITPDAPPPLPPLPTHNDRKPLPHVTLITATDKDSVKVPETTIAQKQYGALSWFFAKALSGEADGNKNGHLERNELDRFLREKVSDEMNNLQKPKLLPRADKQSVIRVSALPPQKRPFSDITIVVKNGSAPSGLKHIRLVQASQAVLRFVIKNQQTEVFNNTGDKITTVPTADRRLWQRVIDKERLLNALATKFDMRHQPIRITLHEGDKLHKEGEVLHFSIAPGDTREGLNALTLFNLAGNGELQFLYPLPEYKDPLMLKRFPYQLPDTQVTPPFGGDDLVVVLCQKPAKSLHALLAKSQPSIPKPKKILSHLRKNRCQVGQYAFFSSKK